MNIEQLRKQVKQLVLEQAGISRGEVDDYDDTAQLDQLDYDSLDTVELVMALEDEFDIEIQDEEFQDVKTIGDVITAVRKHLPDVVGE